MPPPRDQLINTLTLVALTVSALFSTHAHAQDLIAKDTSFEAGSDGKYGLDLTRQTYSDVNSIEVDNISFTNMGDGSPDRPGNGGLRLNRTEFNGEPISKISVSNIHQKGQYDGIALSYYGIRMNAGSLNVDEIIVNTISTESIYVPAFGFDLAGNLGYGTLAISDITASLGAVGLQTGASDLMALSGSAGVIKISNIVAREATGARIQGDATGTQLSVDTVTATSDSLSSANALGIQVEGKISFSEISVRNVTSKDRNATGLRTKGFDDFSSSFVTIDNINGDKSFGLEFSQGYERQISIDKLRISNIGSTDSKESVALDMEGNKWTNGQLLHIENVTASTDGVAIGIRNAPETHSNIDLSANLINVDKIEVLNVSGGDAFGIHSNSDKKHTKVSIAAETLKVAGVDGTNSAFGVYGDQHASFSFDNLTVENITGPFAAAVSVENNSILEAGSVALSPSNWTEYKGGYELDSASENLSIKTFAVRALSGANVTMATGESQSARIYGTIVAGRGGTDSTVAGGNVNIGNNTGAVGIYGDVYAGNGGSIEITLGKESVLEGQVDDYHELNSTSSDTVFRNSAFVDVSGETISVSKAGSATINLNGGTWLARGQSFVKNVNFGAEGGFVDLTKNTNSSVSIENLSGKGQFSMNLGAYTEGSETIESDILYIQNVAAGSSFTIQAHLTDGVTVDDLAGLRFATVGNVEDGHSGNLFKIKIADEGFNNWNFNVATEDYVTGDDDNSRFNGSANGKDNYKPGANAIDAIYGSNDEVSTLAEGQASQNYYIASAQEGASVSDAGQAVIATARGLYYNAVEIDRFNQRYGDRRYDESNNSVWMRVRHDRWGTAAGIGDFKSQNTTYQLGYDYTQSVESGKIIYGAAFDLMDGNTDYESINGSGETKRYALSAYATYMGDNGSYLDVVGKVGRLSNEYAVKLNSGSGVSADYMNWMTALSVETGHQLSSHDSLWFAEPQIQAQYVYISSNDYTNGQTQIDQDSIHSFITRAGFRAGRWLDDEKNANVYVKADVLHEWAGEQDIHVKDKTTAANGDTFAINNHGTWFDVGLGFQAPVGKSFYAYGDAEYRFGNDLDQTWTFNFGGKFVF